jgi:AcrR family transcriptional regulator
MDIGELFEHPGDPALLTPEQRIIFAALDCIIESGLEGATVRAIAAKAGLNAAAVNYYYRTKDRLVETALRSAWGHVSEDIDKILASEADRRTRVGLATSYLVEGAYRYPKLIRAIIGEHPTLRLEAATYMKTILGRLDDRDVRPAADLGSLLLIAFSVLLGFAADAVSLVMGLDLGAPETRRLLAAELAALLYGPFEEPR